VQVRDGPDWTTVASTVVRGGGRHRGEARPGIYRAVFAGDTGPSVRVR
jgi:hypothetical protein